ncbi:hypothetical protein CONLIGDRAFT_635262 [Coniochaeta ligniaria NRRL 30616]|uniref:Uncharacterized protein n=1 Tax=Coniochaeta ligniaria NRRL 30616 TaxID=1408157 RepID=A0A1J7II38_9PEZI|nr:hypothetical protein CONLIGDRAFT_635262 [Coniochaeta ligniaria NRRL 30616]
MPYDNSGSGPLRVPGFSMEIDADLDEDSLHEDTKRGCYFADGIEGWNGQRLTVREIAMLGLMESITDKPDWDKKVFDDAIVDKWHAEAVALPLISEPAWDWVLTEIREKATAFKASRRVPALDSNARCVKSDVLVGADLRSELIAGVTPLLSAPDSQKDWHPGSNNQVLNLVHPSLYPLVYGRTRVLSQGGRVELADLLASCGKGDVAAPTENTFDEYYAWSTRFQWLPCEVEFTSDPDKEVDVRITSYINNLHPTKHHGLYRTIEKIISLSVPLWNDVLMYESGIRTPLRIVTFGAEWTPEMPEWAQYQNRVTSTADPNFAEVMQKMKEYLALPDLRANDPDDEGEFDEDDLDEDPDDDAEIELGDESDEGGDATPERIVAALKRRLGQIEKDPNSNAYRFSSMLGSPVERKWRRIRHVAHPEPGQSFTYEEWKKGVQRPLIAPQGGYQMEPPIWPKKVSLQKWFGAQGLQVIVKLASIELTPENPRYPGGGWHVEGMKNEHIVATSIYYYDVDNTTSSYLSFRQGANLDDEELKYEQDEHEPLSTVFGTQGFRDEPAVQVIGRISTPEGRILAFPNTLQHKVEPFELADHAKPGHRRFLVLWLVDPHFRICSTRNVPPQQHNWWAEEALDRVNFRRLPQEVVDMVKGEIGEWPMGLEEAKALRLDLMAERTRATESVESTFEEYNLCEH